MVRPESFWRKIYETLESDLNGTLNGINKNSEFEGIESGIEEVIETVKNSL